MTPCARQTTRSTREPNHYPKSPANFYVSVPVPSTERFTKEVEQPSQRQGHLGVCSRRRDNTWRLGSHQMNCVPCGHPSSQARMNLLHNYRGFVSQADPAYRLKLLWGIVSTKHYQSRRLLFRIILVLYLLLDANLASPSRPSYLRRLYSRSYITTKRG